MDVALALLPWTMIWGLQLRTSEKIGIGIAMSVGILSGICGIMKVVYLKQLQYQEFYCKWCAKSRERS
jgi:hypothetical protein